MPHHRSRARTLAEYALARAFCLVLNTAPMPVAMGIARIATRLLDRFQPRLRRAALANLAFAMPELDATARGTLIDGVFLSIARVLVYLSRFGRLAGNPANIGKIIRYEGYEYFEQALKQGKGVLFYTAHLGNWELSAFAHALLSRPMHVVVRPLDNPLIDGMVARLRGLSGNFVIGKKEFARGILKALAANEAVGILADQNAGLNDGEFVQFFGKAACAQTGFAKIAAHSGAAVIPGFAIWSAAEGRYILRFYPPVAMTGDAHRDTQRLHEVLEAVIRAYPDQWLWIHRRWKTRPPGEAPLYD